MKQRTKLLASAGLMLDLSANGAMAYTMTVEKSAIVAAADNTKLVVQRPPVAERLFVPDAVGKKIKEVRKLLKGNPYLARMFENCFPNTLDTTVHLDDKDNTFIYTGDIHAMWLHDPATQVWPYAQLANRDPKLKAMLRGTILQQLKCINIDPYASTFNMRPTGSEWQSDLTDMKPELHERKYEIDSLYYLLRLAYHYWQVTGDDPVFRPEWIEAMKNILRTFHEQQRKNGVGPYKFQCKTERQLDTVSNDGLGNPVKPVGLIASFFRPSDDATIFLFLVPSNFMAVSSLCKAAGTLTKVNKNTVLASQCTALVSNVAAALQEYAVHNHPKYGKIYAFEVDGFGNQLLMDDANVPSLLGMAYLDDVDVNDLIYQNTRRFVWSEDNPYFFRGVAGEGVSGPHTGYNMIWPMTIIMKAFTSNNDAEIKECIEQFTRTDAGLGFMHESSHRNDATESARSWFIWQNILFGELVIKLIDDGKLNVLLSAKR